MVLIRLSFHFTGEGNLEEGAGDEDSDTETQGDDDWMPSLLETPHVTALTAKTKKSDIITSLVSIYGTKELFINEYKRCLFFHFYDAIIILT